MALVCGRRCCGCARFIPPLRHLRCLACYPASEEFLTASNLLAQVFGGFSDYCYMGLSESIIYHGIAFGRSVVGLVIRPYETYRNIAERGKTGELFYIALLLLCYFALASIVKVAAFRPFLLTKQFIVLGAGASSGALLTIFLLSLLGKLLGATVRIGTVALAWGYTLVPTVLWFFATSLLYVILPPPRTTSSAGMVFSILFLVFSAALLWWKITLSYLTLRFALRFDVTKNGVLIALAAPVLIIWSIAMYKLGIFKVPFI